MKINPLTIYLWQQVNSVGTSSTLFAVVFGVASAALLIAYNINFSCANGGWEGEKRNYPATNKNMDVEAKNKESLRMCGEIKPWLMRCFAMFIMSSVTATLIPTSQTIAMMVVIPKIAESKIIQQDLPDIYEAAIGALKEQLKPKESK